MLKDGRHFKVADLTCRDGTPYPVAFADRLPELMTLLDKLRDAFGGPLLVVSGYRTDKYNALLATDSTGHQVASGSQHVQGRACDLRPKAGRVGDLYRIALDLHRTGALQELGGIGLYPTSYWVHVDTFHAPDGHLRRWTGT